MIHNQVLFFNDAFSKRSMDELIPRFPGNLERRCTELDVGGEWVVLPDLYTWLREVVFRCGVASFYGENMLGLNPGLEKVFTEFDEGVPFLATGLPRWMRPRAFRARGECLAAVKRWM